MAAPTHTPASDRSIVAATFVAIALFVGSWALLHVGFYTHNQILDTPVYQRYGNLIADGKVPYRDFAVEYPPGALPVFALPGLAEPGHDQHVSAGFRRTFQTLMWICGALAIGAMALVLRALRRPALGVWAALSFAALAPLLLGSVLLSRFDLWPAAIVAGALAALVSGRVRTGHVLLGLGVTAKLYPAVLLPVGLAFVWRGRGRREAVVCAGLAAAVILAIFLPFVILSPGGVWDSLRTQLDRPLQVESLGSALLLAAHHAFAVGVTAETSHGSQNLAGSGAHRALWTSLEEKGQLVLRTKLDLWQVLRPAVQPGSTLDHTWPAAVGKCSHTGSSPPAARTLAWSSRPRMLPLAWSSVSGCSNTPDDVASRM